jgi:hypothetical protein
LACAAPPAFGHGLGLDTLTATVGGSTYEIAAQLPDRFDDESKVLVVTVLDVALPETPDVVLHMDVMYGGGSILQDTFLAEGGALSLGIVTADGEVRVSGERRAGALAGSPEVTGPVFGSGGLYTVQVRIESVGGEAVPDDVVHTLDLLVQDAAQYAGTSLDGGEAPFTIKSYFDVVSEFAYDAEAGTVEFRMPFDWSAGRVSHIPVLHMEVHFPKGMEEFMTRGYSGEVNGVGLFRSSVTVDDFSTPEERTVHFVLLQDHLNLIKAQMERPGGQLPDHMVFTLQKTQDIRSQLSAFTPNGDYQVDMTWEPEVILPDQSTKFIFTIRDAYTGETLRNSGYDFVLVRDGEAIHRESGVAVVGGDFMEYTFTEEQAGAAAVRPEDIRGTGQYVEFTFAVAPEFGAAAALVLVAGAAAAAALSRFGVLGVARPAMR